jgi:hypothetical protein
VTFALSRRGVDPGWVNPVVEAVGTPDREFRESFDDKT